MLPTCSGGCSRNTARRWKYTASTSTDSMTLMPHSAHDASSTSRAQAVEEQAWATMPPEEAACSGSTGLSLRASSS